MVMVSKLSNFSDQLSENDELREFKLSGSDCNPLSITMDIYINKIFHVIYLLVVVFD